MCTTVFKKQYGGIHFTFNIVDSKLFPYGNRVSLVDLDTDYIASVVARK